MTIKLRDPDNDFLYLGDNVELNFGDGADANDPSVGDIKAVWDGSNLAFVTTTADTGAIELGSSGAGVDLVLYGDTATYDVTWDQSADSLLFNDNAKAVFGTGSDVTLRWDGTDLDLLCAADNTVLKFGDGTTSFDLWFHGSVAGNYILWDASANSLTAVGAATIRPFTAIADPGDAGAIPVTVSGYCPLVTAGAETRTLAAPSYIGQELLLYLKTDGGNCTVTCATTFNEAGNNTATFADTGDSLRLSAVEEGANLRWRCAIADGHTLTTV